MCNWYYHYEYTFVYFSLPPFSHIVYTCAAEVAYFQGLMDNE